MKYIKYKTPRFTHDAVHEGVIQKEQTDNIMIDHTWYRRSDVIILEELLISETNLNKDQQILLG